ncbi:MAG: acetyltransferase [Bacteroidales bacterium]|nr:acetyltransferase [Bacteroidales bacterium]
MSKIKKRLFLIGAGNLGREMESWLGLIPNFKDSWQIIGYLDQNLNALKGYRSYLKILSTYTNFDFNSNDYAVICITDPRQKQEVSNFLKNKVRFFKYIAPNVVLGKFVKIGEGVVICPNSCITTNVRIGDFVFINAGTQIGHDCKIESYCSLMSHVDLGGHVTLGKRVYVGTNATIIPGITVGDDIKIGTGAIVIKNLKEKGTYFGNPASLIGI